MALCSATQVFFQSMTDSFKNTLLFTRVAFTNPLESWSTDKLKIPLHPILPLPAPKTVPFEPYHSHLPGAIYIWASPSQARRWGLWDGTCGRISLPILLQLFTILMRQAARGPFFCPSQLCHSLGLRTGYGCRGSGMSLTQSRHCRREWSEIWCRWEGNGDRCMCWERNSETEVYECLYECVRTHKCVWVPWRIKE